MISDKVANTCKPDHSTHSPTMGDLADVKGEAKTTYAVGEKNRLRLYSALIPHRAAAG